MADEVVFEFDGLPRAPLVVDAVYRGGRQGNISDEPLHHLLAKIGNQGGFRPAYLDKSSLRCAYVVVYTTGQELEWPDYLDVETGIFRYYGDNRKPGSSLHETKRGGNTLLREVFERLHTGRQQEVPPFFLFEKTGSGRDVRFLGLAAPGNQHISPDRDLVAFWRSMGGRRFQNYESYFTVLDLAGEVVSREWIDALLGDGQHALDLAPSCWRRFIELGRAGIRPLVAPRVRAVPTRAEQLPVSDAGRELVSAVHDHYRDNPYGFEACACEVMRLMDGNFEQFDLTRPWRDGGRDALGRYRIGPAGHALTVECALEAKCYGTGTAVGVRQMSRLISRIKYRQFGVMVTTNVVDGQAYGEVLEDGHPILIITAGDVAQILLSGGVTPENVGAWLAGVDARGI